MPTTFTLARPDVFAEGETVTVYALTGRKETPNSGAPAGASVTSGAMSGGSVTFSGLTNEQDYIAYAGSPDRYIRFRPSTSSAPVAGRLAALEGIYSYLGMGAFRFDAAAGPQTAGLAEGQQGGSTGGGNLGNAMRQLVQSLYCPAGLSPKLRIVGRIVTNAVAPAINFTVDLKAVTPSGGGAAAITGTAGASVLGSSAVLTAPALTSVVTFDTGDFAAPVDGNYILAVLLSGSMAASSSASVRADLYGRGV